MKRLVVLNKSGHGLFLLCKTKHFFMMLFLLCLSGVSAQTLQVMTDAKGKLGYKDAGGNIVIKCVYDYAEPFDANGLAKVGKGNKYGLIKTDGSSVLPVQYADIEERKCGLPTRVKLGKKYGLIDPVTGSVLLKPEYTFVSRFNCFGLAWFTSGGKVVQANGKQGVAGGKMGVVDKNGEVLMAPKNKGVFEFSEKTSFSKQAVYGEAELLDIFGYWFTDTLKTDCKLLGFSGSALSTKGAGIMDINGKEIVKANLYTWISKPVEGVMRYWKVKSKSVTYGYLDIATGKTASEQTLKQSIKEIKTITHCDFNGNIAPVNSTDGWYFIDKSFETKETGFKEIKFEKGRNLNEGFYAGIADGKSVVYRTDGTKLLGELSFSNVSLPNCEYGTSTNMAIQQNNKWGLCDIDGHMLLNPTYEFLSASYYNCYFFKKNDKFGVVDVKGKELIPAEYINIVYPKEENSTNIWVMTSDSIYYNYDIKQHKTLAQGYKDVSAFKNGMALATPVNAKGNQDDKYIGKYVVINHQNDILFGKPFPLSCADRILEELKKNDYKPISQNKANKLVLKLTQNSVHYAIDAVIPEDGWDY